MAVLDFVITAGPTREYIDPVRFISNPSSGKTGFEIARAAVRRGHRAVLVAGPVNIKTPKGVERLDAVSALDMMRLSRQALASCNRKRTVFIATAAVADWRPEKKAARKLKKNEMQGVLKLKRNPDILKSVHGVKKIGFAAETGDAVQEASRKCREKHLELVVANDVTKPGAGFGTDTNIVSFILPDGTVEPKAKTTKRALAAEIVRFAEKLFEHPSNRGGN
jgi:phosphopantothenoylcysteine decarboxylase/phosphopantothenate--cysteine ligase